MAESNIFKLISREFNRHSVPCVLIGGFAVNYYKVSRQTADVDFLLIKKDYPKVRDILEKAGYTARISCDAFAQFTTDERYFMDVDFMFVDEKTFYLIFNAGKKNYIEDEKFIVPSLEHLIAMKLHSIKHNPVHREYIDLPDIINLIKINKIDFRSKNYLDLCLKYGTGALYNKILKSI